ncbi:MAG TPA: GTPase [Jiangellaceae bacterium]|nr:GTPase [Jiangellaceae bacterium]
MSEPVTAARDLPARLGALEEAVGLAEGLVDDAALAPARAIVERAGRRRQLSTVHTVAALAGATGGGKSSLFNAVAEIDIAEVGVRRPTTAKAAACVWTADGAGPLLDWLQIPEHRRISRRSALDGADEQTLEGMVLLDLPDHDSTTTEHRATVDRLVEQVDLLVWVLDPQKYADALLHDRYLRTLAAHTEVTVVVLNQLDRLSAAEADQCLVHLRELLDDDGLTDVALIGTSAVTGQGVVELREHLIAAVSSNRALEQRLHADLDDAVGSLAEAIGPIPEAPDAASLAQARTDLESALNHAAGTAGVATAAARAYRHRGHRRAAWPVTWWLGRARIDPQPAPDPHEASGRGSVSPPDPEPVSVDRARTESALRAFGATVTGGAGGAGDPVARHLSTAAEEHTDTLVDRLASATRGVDLGDRSVWWWPVVAVAQCAALLSVVVGLVWLLVLLVGSVAPFDVTAPSTGPVPVPVLLLVAGLLAGLGLTIGSAVRVDVDAQRRHGIVEERLQRSVSDVVDETVLDPVQDEFGRAEALAAALARARGRR